MLLYETPNFKEKGYVRFHLVTPFSVTIPSHLHKGFELIYVKSGQMTLTVESRSVTINDDEMALILPFEAHSYFCNKQSTFEVLIFSSDYLTQFASQIQNKYFDCPIIKLDSATIVPIVSTLFFEKSNYYLMKSYLYLIVSNLLQHTELLPMPIKKDTELLSRILSFIRVNYRDNISLSIMAKYLGYNPSYVSRYFNSIFKLSFTDYLNEHRIRHAKYLLENTILTITDISYECGYGTIRTFNRNFVKFTGLTPRSYRTSLIN